MFVIPMQWTVGVRQSLHHGNIVKGYVFTTHITIDMQVLTPCSKSDDQCVFARSLKAAEYKLKRNARRLNVRDNYCPAINQDILSGAVQCE